MRLERTIALRRQTQLDTTNIRTEDPAQEADRWRCAYGLDGLRSSLLPSEANDPLHAHCLALFMCRRLLAHEEEDGAELRWLGEESGARLCRDEEVQRGLGGGELIAQFAAACVLSTSPRHRA